MFRLDLRTEPAGCSTGEAKLQRAPGAKRRRIHRNRRFLRPLPTIQGLSQLFKPSKEQIGHRSSKSLLMPENEYFWCLRGAWRIEQNPSEVCFPSATHNPSRPPTIVERGINETQTSEGLTLYYSFFLEMSEVL